jgi:uncharacterized damage-inducible protein DinB
MNATDVIRTALESTRNIATMYLGDLSDADLLVRPAPSANHIAWQLGHLIASEPHLGAMAGLEAKYPELPAGFAEQHDAKNSGSDTGFATKAVYLDLLTRTRQATLDTVAKLTATDLDRPTSGRMAQFAPTLGTLLVLIANHTMMHSGQFTVVRRKLGKPVLF